MDLNEFLEKKGFKLNAHGVYGLDVIIDKYVELLLVRCTPNFSLYNIEIIVQLGEPKSHIMSVVKIGIDRLHELDFIVTELTRKALYEYQKLINNR